MKTSEKPSTVEALAFAMQDAATAITTAEQAERYCNQPPTDGRYGVVVDWTWGRANIDEKAGLAMIKIIVTRLIEEQMIDLIAMAVQEIQRKAKERKQVVNDLLSK